MPNYPIDPTLLREHEKQTDPKKDQYLKTLRAQEQIIEEMLEKNQWDAGVTSMAYALGLEKDRLPKELLEEVAKLFLDDGLREMRLVNVDIDDPERIMTYFNHTPYQVASFYQRYSGGGIADPAYHRLGEALVKLMAVRYESEKRNRLAAQTYSTLGMKEKAEEMNAKPADERKDERGEYREDFEENVPLFINAVREFQEEFKDFPLLNEGERMENIKKIQAGIVTQLEALVG